MATFTKDASLKIKSYKKGKLATAAAAFRPQQGSSRAVASRSILSVGKQRKAQVTTYFHARPRRAAEEGRFQRRADLPRRAAPAQHPHGGGALYGARQNPPMMRWSPRIWRVAKGSAILAVEMLYQSSDQRNVEFSIARHPADDILDHLRRAERPGLIARLRV